MGISKIETKPKFECSNDENRGKNMHKASQRYHLFGILVIAEFLFEISNFGYSNLFRISCFDFRGLGSNPFSTPFQGLTNRL